MASTFHLLPAMPIADSADSDGLALQARMEAKLRTQVAQLLTPMLGEGNF